jgi:site-specific DNA recombinase
MATQATQRADNALIYGRVSSDKQEDNSSLGTQEAACREYCARNGYAVRGVYSEVFTGSALWERPRLSALREAVRQGEAQVIVVYAIDRLSRDQAHLYIVLDEAERHGARIEFVTEDFDSSPLGKMMMSLKGFAAEVEREKIIERTMRGLKARADSGRLKPGPRALYGYRFPVELVERGGEMVPTVARDRYEIDPATAEVVRRIFRWYVEGMPLLAITTRLNAEGIPSPSGLERWSRAGVHKLLANLSYTGEVYANRFRATTKRGQRLSGERPPEEWIRLPDGVIPPLVDRATWVAAQERARRNAVEATRHNSNPEAYLLRAGHAVCGQCGKAAFATHRTRRRRPSRASNGGSPSSRTPSPRSMTPTPQRPSSRSSKPSPKSAGHWKRRSPSCGPARPRRQRPSRGSTISRSRRRRWPRTGPRSPIR